MTLLLIPILFYLPTPVISGDAVDEYKYVNTYPTGTETIDTEVGTTPYLDSQDQPTNYIETNGNGEQTDWMGLQDTIETGSGFTVTLSLYHASETDGYWDWELDWTDDDSADDSGSFTTNGDVWQWEETGTITDLDTATEINSCRLRITNNKGGGGPDMVRADAGRLHITRPASYPYVELSIKDDGNSTRDGDWGSEPFRYSDNIVPSGQDIMSSDWFYGSGNTTYYFNFTVTWGDLSGQTKGLWLTQGSNSSIETIDCSNGAWRMYVYYTQNINDKVTGFESGVASDQYGNISFSGLTAEADYWFKIELDIQEDVLLDTANPYRGYFIMYAEGT